MAMTMMALGEFRFALETAAYERLVLSQSWRWPKHDRITRDPALQFVGLDTAEIALEGVIYPSFKGGLGQIERLRAMADEGRPLLLTDGLGRVWGKWAIERIEDARTHFTDDGQPRKIEFRLTLKAYGEDGQQVRWTPLAGASTKPAPMAAPRGSDADPAGLEPAIEALPAIAPELPEDVIAAAGETSASILDRLEAAIGAIAQDLRQAALAIGSLPQRLPAAVDVAVRDLVSEIDAFVPAPTPRPAEALGWLEAIPQAARAIAGHGEMIAAAGEIARQRLMRAAADDPRLEPARDLADAMTEAQREMRACAALGRRVLERWT